MDEDKQSYLVPFHIFKDYTPDNKLNTLFHYMSAAYQNSTAVEHRVQKLEKRKLFDRGLSIGSGGVGGFLAIMSRWVITKFL